MTTTAYAISRPDVLEALFVAPRRGQVRPLHSVVRVYDFLMLASNTMGIAQVTYARIQAATGLSDRAVKRAMIRLAALRLILLSEYRETSAGGRGDRLRFRVCVRSIYRLFKGAAKVLRKAGSFFWLSYPQESPPPHVTICPPGGTAKPSEDARGSFHSPGALLGAFRAVLTKQTASKSPDIGRVMLSTIGRMVFHSSRLAEFTPAAVAELRDRLASGDWPDMPPATCSRRRWYGWARIVVDGVLSRHARHSAARSIRDELGLSDLLRAPDPAPVARRSIHSAREWRRLVESDIDERDAARGLMGE